jgi:hypothetical protein
LSEQHWFLFDAEWQKAFVVVRARPSASIRMWARELGWKHTRVARFLDGMARHGLADVISTTKGTTIRIHAGVELPDLTIAGRHAGGAGSSDGISPRVRFAVFSRDRFTCQYCGARGDGVVLEVDHIVPVARGGSDDESNLTTACRKCNSGKSDQVILCGPEQDTSRQAVTPANSLQPQQFQSKPGVPPVTRRDTHLGSKALDLDVPRYEKPKPKEPPEPRPIADPDDVRLIRAANAIFSDRNWDTISEDNFGSLKAAKKILALVPVDRAIPLLESACRVFNPSKTGGDVPRSLGHPFFAKHVVGEWRRIQKDLEGGQLSMLFVEDSSTPQLQEYKPEPGGVTDPAVVSAVMLDVAAKLGLTR